MPTRAMAGFRGVIHVVLWSANCNPISISAVYQVLKQDVLGNLQHISDIIQLYSRVDLCYEAAQAFGDIGCFTSQRQGAITIYNL